MGTIAVRECMSTDVSPVRPDTSLVEAAQLMRSSGVGGVLVLDREGEGCVGILTERDIVVRVLAEGREPRAVFVRDVATMDPVTCTPEEDVETATSRMREYEVQHLPVCLAGKVVGMISLADIVFGRPDEERGTIVPPRAMSR
ncbi:MAG TPA: CBS domain-containing protein [Solirubrobacterales bacterium]|nr:CBS domain-containing protein [Solirubrobacterales bacterium]